MQNASTLILMHVDCGYGAFCKRSPGVLYCKIALSGVLRNCIINVRCRRAAITR